MTAADFNPFVERMIGRYEGGYGWDANDPGGPTKFGITCYDLAEHRGQRMDSMSRWAPLVKAMTLTEADSIYAEKYATACWFNDLGAGKDCVVFDFGVNSGPSRSVKCAQDVVGVGVDGILGPITLSAINSYEPRAFINGLCDTRLEFLRTLGIWRAFGAGWSSRVFDLRSYSLNLAFPLAKASPTSYTDKLDRIPMAFAKGWEAARAP